MAFRKSGEVELAVTLTALVRAPKDKNGIAMITQSETTPPEFWSYAQARKFVRSMKLNTALEFQQWAAGKLAGMPEKPQWIPSNPHQYYSEWHGFADWLGTDRVANFNRKFLPYDEARAFVAWLGLETGKEWQNYCAGKYPRMGKRPAHIPSNPSTVYKYRGWCGIRHWLGSGGPSLEGFSKMRPFEEARDFARSLGLSGQLAWRDYVSGKLSHLPKRPADIPSNPNVCYKGDGWSGYGDFLGTGNVAHHRKVMRPFKEAREFARSLGFQRMPNWRAWAKTPARPVDVPSNPEKTYSSKWRGWRDWLRAPYVRSNQMNNGAR